jgi:alkylation response protein AidB-like acyl-CoA dehydrogenase
MRVSTDAAPLAGLRVLEISSFVAAPLGGLTLAQLGADVIRIDPAGGGADLGRWPLAPSGVSLYLTAAFTGLPGEVVEDAFRIHGGYGYSSEYEIERLYRDAPMLLIGEGTSEIQKMIIGQRLAAEY